MRTSNVDQVGVQPAFHQFNPLLLSRDHLRPGLLKNYAGTYENMGRGVMMINIFMQVIGS